MEIRKKGKKRTMKRIFLGMLLGAIALISVAGCGGGTGGSSMGGGSNGGGGGPTMISVSASNTNPTGFAFQSPVTVTSGSKVEWVNNTGAVHGITWDSQVPNSSPAPPGTVANFNGGATSNPATMPVVSTQTTYNYHCTIHGSQMAGQVIVTP